MIWPILAAVSLLIFFVLTLSFWKRLKRQKAELQNYQGHNEYVENTLKNETYLAGNYNLVYENNADSKSVIDQYIISHEEKVPYLICHFKDTSSKSAMIEIRIYDAYKKVRESLFIEDYDAFLNAPYLKLPGNTVDVNIVLHDLDPIEALYDNTQKVKRAYKRLALHESLAFLFLLPALSYGVLYLLAGYRTKYYMVFGTIVLGILFTVTAVILNYGAISLWITRKIRRRGGFVE